MAKVDSGRVFEVIFSAIRELNDEMDPAKQLPVGENTTLIGNPSKLTSLDLVSLIVKVEEKVADEFDVAIPLADEKAMSQKNSPFRSVSTLSQYVVQLLEQKAE